jgi:hypothetical protein
MCIKVAGLICKSVAIIEMYVATSTINSYYENRQLLSNDELNKEGCNSSRTLK